MDFKETCLWMSYRYAIGRKSIAAVSHAAEIAKHLDWIPEDRWEFTAEDILREVNQSIGWTDNLSIMGLDGHRKTDVFSVLFSFIEKNPTYMSHDMFNKHHWVINLDNGNVSVMEKEEPTNKLLSIFYDYNDYRDWIKLAKILKNETVNVTLEYNGETVVEECYEFWECSLYNGEVSLTKRYSKVRGMDTCKGHNFMIGWHISPEYIKNVEYK
jgi:hypothetical protein